MVVELAKPLRREAAMHRAESPMMRTLRQLDMDRRRLSVPDTIALVVGYTLIVSAAGIGLMTLLDWLDGRPVSVLALLGL